MVVWASQRAKKDKEIEKLTKNKLHQVYGAYFDQSRTKKIKKILADLPSPTDENALKSACREILQFHASSRERLPILTEFYQAIFQHIGQPQIILDLACGLNPLTLPWMLEYGDFQYHAADIDHGSVALFNQFFEQGGFNAKAFTNDLLFGVPKIEADVIFLFKTLPCLEQQEKGISQKLLQELADQTVVLSFPAKSLGGKDKGMYEHYRAFLEDLMLNLDRNFTELRFDNETVYVLGEG